MSSSYTLVQTSGLEEFVFSAVEVQPLLQDRIDRLVVLATTEKDTEDEALKNRISHLQWRSKYVNSLFCHSSAIQSKNSFKLDPEDVDKHTFYDDISMARHGLSPEAADHFADHLEEDMQRYRAIIADIFFCDFSDMAKAFSDSKSLTVPTRLKSEYR